MVVALVLGFLIGAVIGSRAGWLRRLFTPRQQMQEEVQARAREIFFDQRVHHTQGATGLLIYVSLYERLALVLGDKVVLEVLGQAKLDQLCQQLTEDLVRNDCATALRTL
jgi:putative membrane protein